MDRRETLIDRGILTVSIEGRVFHIDEKMPVGRGGSCLVYYAFEEVTGESAFLHKVILKEFHPMVRKLGDRNAKLKHFKKSYENFLLFHNHPHTNHYVVDADRLIKAHGTWYQVMDYNEGISLAEYMKNCSLYDFFTVIRNAAIAIYKLHELGYLHLDVTPGNILVHPESKEVKIMDTDTIVAKKEILQDGFEAPFSSGYAAPEVLDPNLGLLSLYEQGELADVFSIGAIVYSYLYGKRLNYSELKDFTYEETLREYILQKYASCGRAGILRIQRFLRETLAGEPQERLESMPAEYRMDYMRWVYEELEKILPYVEEGRVHIKDNFIPNQSVVYGREKKLKELEKCFAQQGSPGANRICFISGIGGIGKSALAKEYGRRHEKDYDIMVEVSASSAKQAFLGIELVWEENAGMQDLEERTERLIQLLDKRKMLLIVHDYNVSEDVYFRYFRKLPCDILLTTWNQWTAIPGINLSTEDFRSEELKDAVEKIFGQYYLKRAYTYGNAEKLQNILSEEKAEVYELAGRMDFHPLTIKVQAMQMSYVVGEELRPSQMLSLLLEKGVESDTGVRLQHLRDEADLKVGDAYNHLEWVFRNALKRGILLQEEKEVLRLMILMSTSYGVSVSRFAKWTRLEKDKCAQILAKLVDQGWLEYQEEGMDYIWEEKQVYFMPMAIQEVLYRQEEMTCTLDNCGNIYRYYIKDDFDNIPYLPMQQRLEHGRNLVRYVEEEETEDYAGLLHVYSLQLYCSGERKDSMELAVKYGEKSLALRKQVWGEDAEELIYSYTNLGVFYKELCQREKAYVYHKKLIELCLKHHGETHPSTVTARNNYANILMADGEYGEGARIYEELIKVDDRYMCLYNLGLCYTRLGRSNEGIVLMEKAIAMALEKNDFGKLAIFMENAGNAYLEVGQLKRGRKYLEEALTLTEELYGLHHHNIATICQKLGVCCINEEDKEGALSFFERAERIFEKALTEDHNMRVANLISLGTLYFENGGYEKGLEYLLRAIEIVKSSDVVSIEISTPLYNNMASVYFKCGEVRLAKLFVEKAICQGETYLEGMTLLSIYTNAGNIYSRLGEQEVAQKYLSKAQEIQNRLNM